MGKRNSRGGLKSGKYGGWLTPLLFWPKTAGRSLQCADAHYRGGERTSNLAIFLASHGQYAYTNGPKLEHKTWYSLFDHQIHIHEELHLCCQKTKSAVFTLDFLNQNFFEGGVFGPYYLELWRFVSRSCAKHQLSSSVIIESKSLGCFWSFQ